MILTPERFRDKLLWYVRDKGALADMNETFDQLVMWKELAEAQASCGIKGHYGLNEIGDEYGHFYCAICRPTD